MKIKHINPTQRVPSPDGFLPLMRNEVPYFENLNRPARSAYDYVDLVNTYVSYGGHISILQPGIDQLAHTFTLYEIVKITDDELVMPANPTEFGSHSNRYGIVVVEATVDPTTQVASDIVVCTFCPNFVYPDSTIGQQWDTPGSDLFLNTTSSGAYLTSNSTSSDQTQIGYWPIAKRTGRNSIFFCGTTRLFQPMVGQ